MNWPVASRQTRRFIGPNERENRHRSVGDRGESRVNIFLAARKISGTKAGIGNYAFHLIMALARIDRVNQYRVFLGTRWRRGMRDGGNLFASTPGNFSVSMPKIPSNAFRFGLDAFPGLVGRLLLRDIDVYHETDNIPLQAPRGVGVVNTVHDLCRFLFPEFDPPNTIERWRTHRDAIRNVDRVITISHHSKGDIVEFLQIPEDRIRVIYPGVSAVYRVLPRDLVAQELHGLGIGVPYILFTGTITPRKNLDQLVRAFAGLTQRRRDFPILVLAGSKGWKWEPTFDLIEQLKLGPRVRHLGYVSDQDLAVLYNGAAAFVYPSWYEGFGFPPLEAMACGCPTIVSNASSLPEVVGDAARLVDPRDPEALAEALERVVFESGTREGLRARGLERARLFSWETAARQTLEVYGEVMKDRGSLAR